MWRWLSVVVALMLCPAAAAQAGAPLGRLVDIEGETVVQAIGFGLVVGLDGSGDRGTTNPVAQQLLDHARKRLGLEPMALAPTPNMAAVVVVATLPAYGTGRAAVDVQVHALSNARALAGGTLLATPLAMPDGKTIAHAQGVVLAANSKARNTTSSGQIPSGALLQRAALPAPAPLALVLVLRRPDAATAQAIAETTNSFFGETVARVTSPASVALTVPAAVLPHLEPMLAALKARPVEVNLARLPPDRSRIARQILPDAAKQHLNKVFATNLR